MSNEAEVKETEAVEVTEEATKTIAASAVVQGTVTIELREDGALAVNAPGNVLIALAIIKAGEVYLTMGMQDQMRRAAASRPPAIVPGNTGMLDMMKKLGRPS